MSPPPPPPTAAQPLPVGQVLTLAASLLGAGLVLGVLGAVRFPPLRESGWVIGAAAGAGLAALVNVGLRVRRGTPEQRFAWRVLGGLASPGLLACGVGAVLLLNGALDRSAPVDRLVTPGATRRSNVEGDDAPAENVLIDVDDWAQPGATLTLRFDQPPALRDGKLALRTHRGLLGIEWRAP